MTATFADYVAQQDARNTIQLNVIKWTWMLCDALRQNFIDYSIQHHERNIELHEENPAITFYSGGADYHNACITDLKNGNCGYEFYPETGRKYHKIIMIANGSRSVHAFIDKKTGSVYKSASWKAPAKGIRYDLRIIEQREWLFENADWTGGYLYAK